MSTSPFISTRRPKCALLLLAILVGLSGCQPALELTEVRGKVTFQGEPVSEGSVLFVPERGVASLAALQPDGTYRLSAGEWGDGAVLGWHQVSILPPNPLADASNAPVGKQLPLAPLAPPPKNIPPRYQDSSLSGLRVEVKPGGNVFDFDLKP